MIDKKVDILWLSRYTISHSVNNEETNDEDSEISYNTEGTEQGPKIIDLTKDYV